MTMTPTSRQSSKCRRHIFSVIEITEKKGGEHAKKGILTCSSRTSFFQSRWCKRKPPLALSRFVFDDQSTRGSRTFIAILPFLIILAEKNLSPVRSSEFFCPLYFPNIITASANDQRVSNLDKDRTTNSWDHGYSSRLGPTDNQIQ